jgi:hypothetical protein
VTNQPKQGEDVAARPTQAKAIECRKTWGEKWMPAHLLIRAQSCNGPDRVNRSPSLVGKRGTFA